MYILSQILIIFSDLFCILSMLNKKKKQVVFYLILSTIFFATHYMCLGGWTGAVIGLVEIVFLILMYILEVKNKTQYNTYLSLATMFITIILSVLTWSSWISFLPMIAMIIYLSGLIFKNVIIVKITTFIRITLNAIYMLLLKSYFGAGLSIVILIFTIIGIVNDYNRNNQKNN